MTNRDSENIYNETLYGVLQDFANINGSTEEPPPPEDPRIIGGRERTFTERNYQTLHSYVEFIDLSVKLKSALNQKTIVKSRSPQIEDDDSRTQCHSEVLKKTPRNTGVSSNKFVVPLNQKDALSSKIPNAHIKEKCYGNMLHYDSKNTSKKEDTRMKLQKNVRQYAVQNRTMGIKSLMLSNPENILQSSSIIWDKTITVPVSNNPVSIPPLNQSGDNNNEPITLSELSSTELGTVYGEALKVSSRSVVSKCQSEISANCTKTPNYTTARQTSITAELKKIIKQNLESQITTKRKKIPNSNSRKYPVLLLRDIKKSLTPLQRQHIDSDYRMVIFKLKPRSKKSTNATMKSSKKFLIKQGMNRTDEASPVPVSLNTDIERAPVSNLNSTSVIHHTGSDKTEPRSQTLINGHTGSDKTEPRSQTLINGRKRKRVLCLSPSMKQARVEGSNHGLETNHIDLTEEAHTALSSVKNSAIKEQIEGSNSADRNEITCTSLENSRKIEQDGVSNPALKKIPDAHTTRTASQSVKKIGLFVIPIPKCKNINQTTANFTTKECRVVCEKLYLPNDGRVFRFFLTNS